MKRTDLGYSLLAIIVIIGSIYSIYVFASKFIHIVLKANPTLAAAIIAASTTVIISILTIFFGRYLERKKAIEVEIRNKKIPIYEAFIKDTISFLLKKDENKDVNELGPMFMDFSHKLIVWGNQKVIQQWVKFKTNAANARQDLIMDDFEQLLLAIRKDIGLNSENLKQGDIMSIFINDYKEHIEKLKLGG